MAINIKPFTNILVVLDTQGDNDVALARAVKLAKASEGQISVFFSFHKKLDAAHGQDLPDDLAALVDHFEYRVKAQLAKWNAESLLKDMFMPWQHKTSNAIDHLHQDKHFDLVIKSPHPQTQLKSLFHSRLDKYFIGRCPIPVWMVKPRMWDDSVEIMACLDIGDDKFDNQTLNRKIMAMGDHLAHRLGGELHVLDCYYGEIGTMRIDYNHERGFKHEPSLKAQHVERLKDYIHGYSLPDDVLHFEEGIPDEAIPDRAERLNAELAIIGNNEDSNFIDKFLGDTAAELTKAMPCDVLILKPDPN